MNHSAVSTTTSWTPDLRDQDGPIYLSIAAAMTRDINEGRLRPGARLPSHRDLAKKLGLTMATVAHAYSEVARKGLIEAGPGRGTYVKATARQADFGSRAASPSDVIDLTINRPVTNSYVTELSAMLDQLSSAPELAHLETYQRPGGSDFHREAGVAWLKRYCGIAGSLEQVLVTGGAQHGIAATLISIATAGDVVLTEELTYTGLKALSSTFGFRLHGVATDEHGLRPDALEEALRLTSARILVCVPNLHNPTTRTMPEARRREIAAIAKKAGIIVIEDDIYGPLLRDHPAPIAAHLEGRGFVVASATKCIAPGLRIGFIYCPADLAARAAAGIRATTFMAAPLMAEVVARWMLDGTAHEIVEETRRALQLRNEIAREVLGDFDLESQPTCPHVWLKLPEPWRTEEFVSQCEARKLLLVPDQAFAVGRVELPHAVRIMIGAGPNSYEVRKGLEIARDVLALKPEPAYATP